MAETTILSFVIPVFKKSPEVFRRCLASLFDSSLKAIEVIAVFDGPNVELQLVAADFPKVTTLVIEHGGAARARNAGLELATGKYVCFWDADCYAKPGGPKRWVEELEASPAIDFVYFGYEFTGERGTYDSEPFDPYSLQSGNFISSMSPIRREKALPWDESLPAAQDWDYWLTAVEMGLKGAFIEGSGFETDIDQAGISSVHWSAENRDATIERIRKKHGIPDRRIGVYSMNYRERGSKLARILGADVIKPTGFNPDRYDLIFNLGYGFLSRFEGLRPGVSKVQFWLPGEIAGLAEAKYSVVMETIRIAKGVANFCNTEFEKNKLAELGVTAEVLPLPLAYEDLEKAEKTLPEQFSILLLADAAYGELLKDIALELPQIPFKFNAGKTKDFSCLLSFYQFAALDDPIQTAHVNGRQVISNVQAPFCGFIDPDQPWEKFKADLFEAIREAQKKPFNQEAADFYLDRARPQKFIKAVSALLPTPILEVA